METHLNYLTLKTIDFIFNRSVPRLFFALMAFSEVLMVSVDMAVTHSYWFKSKEEYLKFIDMGIYTSVTIGLIAFSIHFYHDTKLFGGPDEQETTLLQDNFNVDSDDDLDDERSCLTRAGEAMSLFHAMKKWQQTEKANLVNSLTAGFYLSYVFLSTLQNLFRFDRQLNYKVGLVYYIVPGAMIAYIITLFAPLLRNTWNQRSAHLAAGSETQKSLEHTYYQGKLCLLMGLNFMQAINACEFLLVHFSIDESGHMAQILPYLSGLCIFPLVPLLYFYYNCLNRTVTEKNEQFYNIYAFAEFIKLASIFMVSLNAIYVIATNENKLSKGFIAFNVIISTFSAVALAFMNAPKLFSPSIDQALMKMVGYCSRRCYGETLSSTQSLSH